MDHLLAPGSTGLARGARIQEKVAGFSHQEEDAPVRTAPAGAR